MTTILRQHHERWPDRETGPLEICVTIGMIDGRPEAIGFEAWGVHPAVVGQAFTGTTGEDARARWRLIDPDREAAIRTDHLRIPLGRIVEGAVAKARREARVLGSDPVRRHGFAGRPAVQREAARLRAALDGDTPVPKRRGRLPLPRPHYEEVARVYEAAETNPTQAVADHFVVSKGQAAKWVYRCRREPLNLLPPTHRGRPTQTGPSIEER